MSSARSYKAQPLSRSFVVSGADGGNGPWTFTQANINTWVTNNADSLTAVGSLITIPSADFLDVLYTGGSSLPNSGTYNDRRTLLDLGKEYVIGNDVNSRLIVLRLVLFPSDTGIGALGGEAKFVVIENNCSDIPTGDNGRFSVRVARI
jgi:hypothetical protein